MFLFIFTLPAFLEMVLAHNVTLANDTVVM